MTLQALSAESFLAIHADCALVSVIEVKGSTPRELGAWMLVSPKARYGTIGGGQLEFMAMDAAREMLASGVDEGGLDIPLGPEIGQCCGGRVGLSIERLNAQTSQILIAKDRAERQAYPHVLIFGGGHVGHALAASLSLLPVQTMVVETREGELEDLPVNIRTCLTPVPEEMVREAPSGSAIVVLTHDHALDFLIVGEALARNDLPYVGMIGSKTKKATFKSWYLKEAGGDQQRLERLICPIGGAAIADKRPAIIASLVAAEIITILLRD